MKTILCKEKYYYSNSIFENASVYAYEGLSEEETLRMQREVEDFAERTYDRAVEAAKETGDIFYNAFTNPNENTVTAAVISAGAAAIGGSVGGVVVKSAVAGAIAERTTSIAAENITLPVMNAVKGLITTSSDSTKTGN